MPSTIDPDVNQPPDKSKRLPQRPVRISAWKLAKLDSNDAIKAGAKARASSSVLRPLGSRHHPYDADHLSSSNVSGRSSPISTDQRSHHRNARVGTSRLSPAKSSYPPSRASREDLDTCRHSLSNLGSPPNMNNLTPSPLDQQISNSDHFNPIYQSSADQSPWSVQASDGNGNVARNNEMRIPMMRNNLGPPVNSRASVFWDPEAGRFVSTASRSVGSSSQVSGTELLFTGQSIFFGGPLVSEQSSAGTINGNNSFGAERGSTLNRYQQGRPQRGGQLPVFVPSDSQQNHFSSRLH